MHIAVNTRMLQKGKLDGIGWFSHEVLSRITRQNPEVKFTFLFDRKFSEEFIYADNVEPRVLIPPARHPLLYRWYFGVSIPRVLAELKPDLFFSPDGFLTLNTNTDQIPVIHDINFEHRPQDLPKAYSNYYRTFFPRFAKKAREIITVSSYSADDISNHYGVARNKIHVAYNGANEAYRPISDEEKTTVKSLHTQGRDYLIFVGNFSFRKNIHGLIKSYDLYRANGGDSLLVLVGNPLWIYPQMQSALDQSAFKNDILFKGHLPLEKLTNLMAAANALILPSYFEGFGIPIIEAFKCGTPVITSDRTSLTEVAGEAALICSPDQHQKIADNIFLIERNLDVRFKLIESGKIRSKEFNWDNTANKISQLLFHHRLV